MTAIIIHLIAAGGLLSLFFSSAAVAMDLVLAIVAETIVVITFLVAIAAGLLS